MESNSAQRRLPEKLLKDTKRAAARRELLYLIREVIETTSMTTAAELTFTGNWIVFAALPDAKPCKLILGRIAD